LLIHHLKTLVMSLGWNEILLILLVVLLLFGGRKIPELMRGLGKGIREFNDAKSNVRREIEEGISEKERPATTTTEREHHTTTTSATSQP
jgi:sec-independent protein translocase protein TatA